MILSDHALSQTVFALDLRDRQAADARQRTAALEALEAADRCAVFTGASSAEAGVKFFREE